MRLEKRGSMAVSLSDVISASETGSNHCPGRPAPRLIQTRLTNRTSGEQVRTTGDGQGAFEFIALEPAVYSLGASSRGFERIFRRFSVEAGADIQEGLVLQLGSLKETINVAYTAEPAPAVTTITPAARERYRAAYVGFRVVVSQLQTYSEP